MDMIRHQAIGVDLHLERISARADQRDNADNPLPPQTPPDGYGLAALRDAGNSVKQYVPSWAYLIPPPWKLSA